MEPLLQTAWFPFAALFLSNIFRMFAWYRHLKFKDTQPLGIAIAASWGLAFFEYCSAACARILAAVGFTFWPAQ